MKRQYLFIFIALFSLLSTQSLLALNCTRFTCNNQDKFLRCLQKDTFIPDNNPHCMQAAIKKALKDRTFWSAEIEKAYMKRVGEKSGYFMSSTRTNRTTFMDLWEVVHTRPIYVLSIDGGGIKGLIPGIIISEIEKELGRKITDIFNVFFGTSTGGLITLFLNVPDDHGQQKYPASEVVRLYKSMAQKAFKRRKFLGHYGLTRAKYDAGALQSILQQYYGNTKISESVRPVVLTSYDGSYGQYFLFSTFLARDWPQLLDFNFVQAGRATSAAPTFFDPMVIKLTSDVTLSLVDGGIFANNPSVLAATTIKKKFPDNPIVLVSLGTGEDGNTQDPKTHKSGALLSSSTVASLKGLFESPSDISTQAARTMVGKPNFYRLVPKLVGEELSMDNVESDNLKRLEQRAMETAQTEEFKKMISFLKQELQRRDALDKIVKDDINKNMSLQKTLKGITRALRTLNLNHEDKETLNAYRKNLFNHAVLSSNLLHKEHIIPAKDKQNFVEWVTGVKSSLSSILKGIGQDLNNYGHKARAILGRP